MNLKYAKDFGFLKQDLLLISASNKRWSAVDARTSLPRFFFARNLSFLFFEKKFVGDDESKSFSPVPQSFPQPKELKYELPLPPFLMFPKASKSKLLETSNIFNGSSIYLYSARVCGLRRTYETKQKIGVFILYVGYFLFFTSEYYGP